MPSYLITGASRGLGLAFAAELLKNNNNTVIATARNTAGSTGLQELKAKTTDGRLVLIDLDVSKAESIHSAAVEAAKFLPNGLDHLISNAGVATPQKALEEIDLEIFKEDLSFTVTAPILLLKEFLPLIRKGTAKRILFVSSVLGSIQDAVNVPGLAGGYSVARAALNMLGRKWSTTLKNEGIILAILHPGWVPGTDIGVGLVDWMAANAPDMEAVSVVDSATNSMKVLNGLTIEDAGAFFNHDGSTIPF